LESEEKIWEMEEVWEKQKKKVVIRSFGGNEWKSIKTAKMKWLQSDERY
jgi:hypothetical protein